ncbi:MAG: peptidyl-prolyl cis-trans isomerase [Myxococcales bacterium]|nr:peptidyl-prolyl cis-trans isomerase [Myxococcales bacterium]
MKRRALWMLALAAVLWPGGSSHADEDAEAKRRAQPLAVFEGGQVTVGDLEDAIKRQSPFMRKRYQDPAELQKLLAKTVRFALLAQEAERQGFGTRPSVEQAVKQNAVQALMKLEFDEKLSADAIPGEEVEGYYQEHIDEYVRPATRRASHIMVATLDEAKALLAQARDKDLREFRQLAREHTIDEASKMRGGDLRYFDDTGKVRNEQTPSIPPALVKATFKLKTVGDLVKAPVKLEGGYSIIKLTGSRPALSRKLSDVEETIRVRLWRKQRQAAIDTFITDLRGQYKPDLKPKLVEKIKLDQPVSAKGPGIPENFPHQHK